MKTRLSPPKVDLRVKGSDGTRRLRGRIGLTREFHGEGKDGDNAVDNFLVIVIPEIYPSIQAFKG